MELNELDNLVVSLTIETADDLEKCQQLLSDCKRVGKDIEAKKRAMLDPINASAKAVREMFKPVEDKLEQTEKETKELLSKFRTKLDTERREIIKKSQEEGMTEAPIALGSGGEEGLVDFIFTLHLFITLIYCLKKSYAK